jgi:putative flippase GtrA
VENLKNNLIVLKLSELLKKYKSFIRFAIVGCLNTGVDFLTFTVFQSVFGINSLISQVAGYSLGLINSFIWNKIWTFESKKSKIGTLNQMVKFICINAVTLGITLLGLYLLNNRCHINVYIAKIIVTVLAQIVNYFGYKLWVFSTKKIEAA